MFLKEISLVGSVSAEIIPSKSLSHEDPQKVITTKILQMSTFTPVIFADKKLVCVNTEWEWLEIVGVLVSTRLT